MSDPRVDASSVIAHARERLARFKVPREVLIVAELPKTGTGRVAKVELRRWTGGSDGPSP